MKTFSKEERICGKITIDDLVAKGKSFNSFPFRIVWLEVKERKVAVKVVISVPKRIFKRAVDRNRLKRLTREGYRMNKEILSSSLKSKKVNVLFVYTAKTILEGNEMQEKMVVALTLLAKKILL
ncbi:MAG: ribonuclease P protein component [Bacteroidota bacterium]